MFARPGRVACLWLRVSEDKGQNVEAQERDLRAAAAQMGLTVPDELVFRMQDETAHSVFKGDPPEKKTVLELARKRRFSVLLVWSLDRWSRRRRDGLREVFETLPACGVTVFSHEEPFLTTEGIPDFVRENVASALLWLAEEDSKRKSRRVKARYETNRNRAEGGGGKAKWGRGRVPSRDEVETIMMLSGQGMSIRTIAGRTGVPRSTVGRLVSQSSRTEGGARAAGTMERPEGALGTPAVGGQNIAPATIGPARPAEMPSASQAVSDGGA